MLEAAERANATVPEDNRSVVTGVESALVLVNKPDGTFAYSAVVLRGQEIPEAADEKERDRLAREGAFRAPAVPYAQQTEAERAAVRLAARG